MLEALVEGPECIEVIWRFLLEMLCERHLFGVDLSGVSLGKSPHQFRRLKQISVQAKKLSLKNKLLQNFIERQQRLYLLFDATLHRIGFQIAFPE